MTEHEEKLQRKAVIWAEHSDVFDQQSFFNGQGLPKDYYEQKDREREKEEREARKRKQQLADERAKAVAAGKALASDFRIRLYIPEIVLRKMYKHQHGCCAICGKELHDVFMVDHSHKHGDVRGLLCRQCNVMLGMAHDDEGVLLRAAKYIKKTEEVHKLKTCEPASAGLRSE